MSLFHLITKSGKMYQLSLLLFTLSTVIFSCGIDEHDRYYVVEKFEKSRFNKKRSLSNYYCKISQEGEKTVLQMVDETSMFFQCEYSLTEKIKIDSSIIRFKDYGMPYSHRMFFLGDSLGIKDRIIKTDSVFFPGYSEWLSIIDSNNKFLRVAKNEPHNFRSYSAQVREYNDTITFKEERIYSGGIFSIDSLIIVARPVSFRKKIQINSLIESNKKE